MRIIYVTSSLPHGKGEAFVIPEIEELLQRGHEVLIVPMYPRGPVLHGDVEPLLKHAVVRPLISLELLKVALGRARLSSFKATFRSSKEIKGLTTACFNNGSTSP